MFLHDQVLKLDLLHGVAYRGIRQGSDGEHTLHVRAAGHIYGILSVYEAGGKLSWMMVCLLILAEQTG